ncbi:MAG TPA: NAD(P)/FAD-dependent oxidoreductase [Desulfomonilaceae bacterium]|nr:NAD(P)/FAD-dependent oxidoreductase [Desulfomonilaceae bacterium]
MNPEHCVIIGNGPAANEAALTLRGESRDLRITVIGQEPVRHYKAYLLPEYVSGKLAEDDLYVNPPADHRERDIKLRLGQKVETVSFDTREIILDHKEVVRFDSLIVAVGGIPRIPERLQVFSDLFLALKTLADARIWKQKLKDAETILMVGGDLTSLSFTKALLAMGKRVIFMINEDSFWPLRFDDEIRSQVTERLTAKGVEVLNRRTIKGLAGISENEVEIETDAEKLSVNAVGAFFGLVPNVKFLARSGLHIDRGILVDDYLRTRFAGVYAAGDCAQVYHPELRDYWVSIGYKNAWNLGKIAALNLIGGKIRAQAVAQSIFRVGGIAVNTSWWTEF